VIQALDAEPHTKEVGHLSGRPPAGPAPAGNRRADDSAVRPQGTAPGPVRCCSEAGPCRSSSSAPCRTTALPVTWSLRRWPLPALQQTHAAYLRAVDEAHPARGGRHRAAGLPHARADSHARPAAALLPRHRWSDGADDRRRAELSAPVSERPQRHGLRLARPLGAFERHQPGPGRITKTGNAHLRRVVVEAAWHYRHLPFLATPCAGGNRGNRRRSVSRSGRRSTASITAIVSSPGGARRNSTWSPRSAASSPGFSGPRCPIGRTSKGDCSTLLCD